MPLRVQCIHCGKLLILGPGAGTTIVCPACGTVQRAPSYDVVEDIRPALARGYTRSLPEQAPLPAKRSSVFGRPVFWISASAVIAIGLSALVLTILLRQHPAVDAGSHPTPVVEWESVHRQEIVGLKLDAERLALSNQMKSAYDKYVELQELVAGQAIADPELRRQIGDARESQQLIYRILLASQGAATQSAALPQAAYPREAAVPVEPATTRAVPEKAQDNPPEAIVQTRPAVPPDQPPFELPPVPGGGRSEGAPEIPGQPNPAQPSRASLATRAAAPVSARAGPLSDEALVAAMNRGVGYLLGLLPDGEIDDGLAPTSAEHAGQDALVVFSLLQASRAGNDPRLDIHGPTLTLAIERLKRFGLESDPALPQAPVTFARSMRAAALAVFNRPEDHAALTNDAAWLVRAAVQGSYTNDDRLAQLHQAIATTPGSPLIRGGRLPSLFGQVLDPGRASRDAVPDIWDNSNSCNGVMGVVAAQQAGVVIPAAYWEDVYRHWTACQHADGQWGSTADDKSGSLQMTCGGIASLLAASEFSDVARSGADGARNGADGTRGGAYPAPVAAGLNWLEQQDNAIDVYNSRTVYLGFNLFNLQRVGQATGFKHFAKHDWFAELAAQVISIQFANGAWGRQDHGAGSIIDTAYITAFLAAGRAPVMMTKLRYIPAWNNHPFDLASLTRYARGELGRPLNFEAVGFDHPWQQWTDAPILYIAGRRAPQLKEADEENLKAFVEAGGMLFTHADGGDPAFDRWVRDLSRRLFPGHDFLDLPATHAIYSLFKPMNGVPPRLQGVSNGARLLLVHSPNDLAADWTRATPQHNALNLGLSLFIYAAGEDRWRPRLDSLATTRPTRPDLTAVPVARVKYIGGWDPEPGAWGQLSTAISSNTGLSAKTVTVDAAQLSVADQPLAHLTGTSGCIFSQSQISAIRDYVNSGGTLVIDACGGALASGGTAEFADSIEQSLLPRAFPDATPHPLAVDDPLMQPSLRGMVDLSQPRLRPFAADKPNTAGFRIQTLTCGKGRVVYSPLDLTSGLLGTHTYGISGYDPGYATAVMKNIVIYVGAGHGY